MKVVINYFLYTLINTSNRVFTENAMNIEAILHVESLHKGKFYTGPKISGLKIPTVPCHTSASFLLGEKSFERRSRWSSARKKDLEKSHCTTVE